MGKIIDLTGQRFGRLRALECVGFDKRHNRRWRCACDCGQGTVTITTKLRSGKKRSCGCLPRASVTQRNLTHGLRYAPEYRAWNQLRSRCSNPSNKHFKHYGGRGIRCCERWSSFENFYADMGPKPSPQHSIDRVNNDGNYEPGNCRWATRLEQANNTSATRWIRHDGRAQSLPSWARDTGLMRKTIACRLDRGWPPEPALTAPIRSTEGAPR